MRAFTLSYWSTRCRRHCKVSVIADMPANTTFDALAEHDYFVLYTQWQTECTSDPYLYRCRSDGQLMWYISHPGCIANCKCRKLASCVEPIGPKIDLLEQNSGLGSMNLPPADGGNADTKTHRSVHEASNSFAERSVSIAATTKGSFAAVISTLLLTLLGIFKGSSFQPKPFSLSDMFTAVLTPNIKAALSGLHYESVSKSSPALAICSCQS